MDKPKCYNRPAYLSFLAVQDGWTDDGRKRVVLMPNRMSTNCASRLPPFGEALLKNWNCEGCKWLPTTPEH